MDGFVGGTIQGMFSFYNLNCIMTKLSRYVFALQSSFRFLISIRVSCSCWNFLVLLFEQLRIACYLFLCIEYMPYQRLEKDYLSKILDRHIDLCCSHTMLICFEKVNYQLSQMCIWLKKVDILKTSFILLKRCLFAGIFFQRGIGDSGK